ncbi:WLM domain-containing protein [Terfezia claveryi]|nr:WLM domain-containing protein [Terfezia claveryi]
MPLGIERINSRRRQPNDQIVFIKPLEGPDKAIAQDFLERVAAVVVPIMRSNHLNVMSLEEFPPNMEFWGRNFNAGECIQLVLKHPRTHMWLSFEQVQYTMIHELAHILQMNHSSAFWSVRNKFANELHALHVKGYTGEGFWSVGRVLNCNQPFLHSRPLSENELPQSLCGGTYRARRRQEAGAPKRKITYAERQQRRKERKFGLGEGERLGGDDTERVKLESGKRKASANTASKAPKIASSKRSRELRAAAALKRLETEKKEDGEEKVTSDDGESTSSEWEDGWEYDQEDEKNAVDIGGGKRLVPVSAKEDASDDEERAREWQELKGCATIGGQGGGIFNMKEANTQSQGVSGPSRKGPQGTIDAFVSKVESRAKTPSIIYIDDSDGSQKNPAVGKKTTRVNKGVSTMRAFQDGKEKGTRAQQDSSRNKEGTQFRAPNFTCVACSTANPPSSITCTVCANVLNPKTYTGSWKCRSGGEYWNSPDCGRCAVCGEAR